VSWPYREVSGLSEHQKGQLSHEQLQRLGVGDKAIQHSLEVGRITETFSRVYAVGDRALPPLWREMGAVLACGEGSFVSRHWAAAAWGIRPPASGDVDATVPYGRNARRSGIRIHRSRRIDPRDVTELDGVPICTPAFALLEIALELSMDLLERAFDDGLTSRVMSLAAAQDTLDRHRNRRDAKLAGQGWLVLRFTWRQLTSEPELVIARLAQTLALRQAG
jgi:hypothetical protein